LLRISFTEDNLYNCGTDLSLEAKLLRISFTEDNLYNCGTDLEFFAQYSNVYVIKRIRKLRRKGYPENEIFTNFWRAW